MADLFDEAKEGAKEADARETACFPCDALRPMDEASLISDLLAGPLAVLFFSDRSPQ